MNGTTGMAVIAATGAGIVKVGVDTYQTTEPMLGGAASSLLASALLGSILGLWWYRGTKGKQPFPGDGEFGIRYMLGLAWRAAGWGLGVALFTFLAAWSVTAFCLIQYKGIPPAAPPLTGILAVFIYPLLPKYQAAVEGSFEAVVGAFQRAFGGPK